MRKISWFMAVRILFFLHSQCVSFFLWGGRGGGEKLHGFLFFRPLTPLTFKEEHKKAMISQHRRSEGKKERRAISYQNKWISKMFPQKYNHWLNKCIKCNGGYFEGDKFILFNIYIICYYGLGGQSCLMVSLVVVFCCGYSEVFLLELGLYLLR